MTTDQKARQTSDIAPLPEQWERFCGSIMEGRSQAAAARHAGYSERSSHEQGVRLMRNVKIRARLAQLRDDAAHRLDISADKVLHEFARIAFGDIRRVVKWRNVDGETVIVITPSSQLSADDAAMIQSIEHEVREVGRGVKIKTTRVKFYDRTKALDALARHLALFNDKFTLDVLVSAIREQVAETAEAEGWTKEDVDDTLKVVDDLIIAGFGKAGKK